MPRIVDHDIRRQTIAEVACRYIADNGVEASTVKNIARAAGYSTTVVSHYFQNKHELLLFAYRSAADGARKLVNEVLEEDPADLQGTLLALMPLTAERRRYWHIWFEFWGMAVGDKAFQREHRRYLRITLKLLGNALRARYGSDNGAQDARYQVEAQRLFAILSGLASQAVFDRTLLTRSRQIALIELEIARLDTAYPRAALHA